LAAIAPKRRYGAPRRRKIDGTAGLEICIAQEFMEETSETARAFVASDSKFEVWTLKFFWILDFEV